MNTTQQIFAAVLATSLFFNSYCYASAANDKLSWSSWPSVGQAQLTVFIFDVYQSQLKTPSGYYSLAEDITPHPLALSIDYQRDISQNQLLDATEEQWEKLGYQPEDRSLWVDRLDQIFPDILEGENLTYVTDGQSGYFYYRKASDQEPALIGTIEDEELNDAFLAIWLSPKTTYPDLRAQLIGPTQ
ncbi:chalcone isomerase family protein [Vibrio atypicus]|uniref:chalcone isomerase family protein n=1 Tax=Vibrio atypicus TaxID=558271 RepID=UPI001357A67D|nr:chalcone isomerase family protein [Vibrio atypicus]